MGLRGKKKGNPSLQSVYLRDTLCQHFLRWLTDAFTFESTTIFQPFSALLNAHLALAPSPPSLPHHPRPPPLLLLLIHLHPLSHRTRPTSSHCGRRTGRGGGSSRSRGSSKGRGSSVPDLKKPTSTFSYVYTHCRKEEEGGRGSNPCVKFMLQTL